MFSLLMFTALAQEPPQDPAASARSGDSAETAPEANFEQAKLLYENGERLYEEAQYEQSILAFREAYALSKQHELLYNISSAQERMGDLEAAIGTLNTFRIYAPTGEQESLSRKLRTLEGRLDEQRLKAKEAQTQALAQELAQAPAPAPVVVAPTPQPVALPANNPLKPVLIGSGGVLGAVFGAATIATFIVGSGADNKSDYDTARVINLTSGSLAIVGAGISAIGFALPAKKKTPGVTVSLGTHSSLTTHWQF